MGFSELIKCEVCGVPNRFGDPRCKICRNPLPRERPGSPARPTPTDAAREGPEDVSFAGAEAEPDEDSRSEHAPNFPYADPDEDDRSEHASDSPYADPDEDDRSEHASDSPYADPDEDD
ncbi:MAG: hypothetical protein D6731_17080, partial [Planctomycetota bacterium]